MTMRIMPSINKPITIGTAMIQAGMDVEQRDGVFLARIEDSLLEPSLMKYATSLHSPSTVSETHVNELFPTRGSFSSCTSSTTEVTLSWPHWLEHSSRVLDTTWRLAIENRQEVQPL